MNEWILLVCWILNTQINCDPPKLKDNYGECTKEQSQIVKKHSNVLVFCRPKPTPQKYEI